MSDRIYHVGIACIGTETHMEITTNSPDIALQFLADNDHVGSSVELTVEYTNDDVRKVLEHDRRIKR